MDAPRGLFVALAVGLLAAGTALAPAEASPPPAAAAAPHLVALPVALPLALPTASPLKAAQPRRIATTRWGRQTVSRGTFVQTRLSGGIVMGAHFTHVSYQDPFRHAAPVSFDRGRWFSPWVRPNFGLSELVASYNASTPIGTFIEVSARGQTAAGTLSSWDSLGRWASHDINFHRMSLGAQADDLGHVAVDTLVTDRGVAFTSWQLRVSLMRRSGTTKTPTVTMVAAMASRLPAGNPATSQPGPGRGHDLIVPRYSQEIHAGEYPQWNGGGEAWCSPTSTSMVVAYWRRGPTPKQYAWVNHTFRQPWIDYAARSTYASGYDGTGDWPFNTAYAGRFGLDSFVTRLRSLREAELFITAGIPLVATISFDAGELDGAPISSTAGHLLVIRGFTADGSVIVNDPAAATAQGVRRVYNRGQFERAWIGGSGGLVYVIRPASKPLPNPQQHTNW